MPTFHALSYDERRRLTLLIARGKAPQDPRMAAAAVELAESYQRRGRIAPTLTRWLAIAVILAAVPLAVLSAGDGDVLVTISMTLVALTNLAHLTLNPMNRPQNVARSLEASRQVLAAKG